MSSYPSSMLGDIGIEMNGLWGSRKAISSISLGISLRPQSVGGSIIEIVIMERFDASSIFFVVFEEDAIYKLILSAMRDDRYYRYYLLEHGIVYISLNRYYCRLWKCGRDGSNTK